MVAIYAVNLRPSHSTSVADAEIDVCECLLNLSVDASVEFAGLRMPTTYPSSALEMRVEGSCD
jgi:hypothetical protein